MVTTDIAGYYFFFFIEIVSSHRIHFTSFDVVQFLCLYVFSSVTFFFSL